MMAVMAVRTKQFILWIPALILVVTTLVVLSFLVSDNRQRISNLENTENPSIITFTFNQPQGSYRVICNLDKKTPNFYVCVTLRIPSPTPTPTSGG